MKTQDQVLRMDDDDDEEIQTKRRPWAPDEDEELRQLVDIHGIKSWAHIATFLQCRNGKQCRERWRNHLRPQLNKGDWTPEEDVEIWDRVQQMGTKWAQISELYMPSRTDNDIKNRWNSIIRKTQHPGGRDWQPEENEERNRILGSASRTQVGRRSAPAASRDSGAAEGREPRERKRKEAGPAPRREDGMGEGSSAEPRRDASPGDGRKLFLSPGSPPSPERIAAARALTPNASRTPEMAAALEAADGGRMGDAPGRDLFGADEMAATTFDVEPFLGMTGSVSQICSPVMEARAASRFSATPQQSLCSPLGNWFDVDLVNSLSPILTPSLRHTANQLGRPQA